MRHEAQLDRLSKMSEIHKALSTPVRLAIMEILSEADRPVAKIQELVANEYGFSGMDPTNVSKHLSILKGLGIINCLKKGQQRIYHLKAKCLMNAMSCALDATKVNSNTNTEA